MDEKVVAIIPVREGSQRIKDKNFRPFADEKSILHLKIRHLQSAGCFDEIYVSSDSQKAKGIAQETGVKFIDRDPVMCNNSTSWPEVINYVAASVPGNPVLAWVHTTSPLHFEYAKPIETFLSVSSGFNSLVVVEPIQEFFVTGKGRPYNYNWGHWHEYSQDLEKLYKVTGALFVARKNDMVKWHYVIGTKPYLYEVSKFESLDVDNPEDFKLAELLYQMIKEGKISCENKTV